MIWNKEYIYKKGLENHYPKCCIDAYYLDLVKQRSPAENRKIDNSGYVPCQKHYKEYKERLRCLKELCKRKEKKDRRKEILTAHKLPELYKEIKKKSYRNAVKKGFQEPGLLEHLVG